jgi:flagellar biosynthesis/type III secretory pathway protein FliH
MTRIISRPEGVSGLGVRGALPRDWKSASGVTSIDDATTARARAARIMLDARREARATLLMAGEAARELIAAECEQARQLGYAEGQARASAELAAVAAPLAALIAGSVVDRAESLRRLDEETLDLSLAIARAVVKHEVTLAPETALAVARAALNELSAGATVMIRVHPGDDATLREGLPYLELPVSTQVDVFADPSITRGGCIVESGAGRVDATVDTQLARMEALLHEQLSAV